MNKIWKLIEEYRSAGAVHKIRGFNLKDYVRSGVRLKAAASEFAELCEAIAITDYNVDADITDDNNALLELADLLIILVDMAQRRDWSLQDIEQAMITKLKERFEIPHLCEFCNNNIVVTK